MAAPELVAETNALLKQFLELEAEQKKRSEEAKAKFEDLRLKRVPPDESELTARMEKTRDEARQKIKESAERSGRHQERVLAELRKQTKLLERIAARLEA